MYALSEIADCLNLRVPQGEDFYISEIVTDSRKLYFPERTLFFALKGQVEGSTFIPELIMKNVRCFVVPDTYQATDADDVYFLKVPDVLQALQQVSGWHRGHFHMPVIGITGSNGKTIVKELLFQLLYTNYRIVRSPKSFNSQLGVSLSVWQMNNTHTLGLFEAGISMPGEMEALEKMILPTVGIFTFAGDAHAAGFSSMKIKIQEKLKLFRKSKVLFYNADEVGLSEEIALFKKNINPGLELCPWSRTGDTGFVISKTIKIEDSTQIFCKYQNEIFHFLIPFTDAASVNNCILCCYVLLYLRFDAFSINQKMPLLRPVEMRLEMKTGSNNCSVINDSYNSDINSLNIALDFLEQQNQHARRSVVLSDVFQSGQPTQAFYQKIAAMLNQKKLYRFVGIGHQMVKHAALFTGMERADFFEDTDLFLEQIPEQVFQNETILLKGARVFNFEKISDKLEQQSHQTVLEINLDAVRHNLQVYRKLLTPGVKLMVMVKAFSYGSGTFEIANLLQFSGVDYLAVAYADEGVSLRKAGITLPMMVLNIDDNTFGQLLQHNLEPEIFSFSVLEAFHEFLEEKQIKAFPVHLKIDTGMHRLGFSTTETAELCQWFREKTTVKIKSVFSHLAASDDAAEDEFSVQQGAQLQSVAAALEKELGYSFIQHISNTSGISHLKDLQLGMVRLGIGLYGVDAHPDMQQVLQTVTTLKTTISQIRKVKAGESVGYGRKAFLEKDSLIATVRIGYADGYRRAFGNGVGCMWYNGLLLQTVGNVCMDMTMLDVTEVDINEGDEVIVFGKELSVQTLSEWSDTIPYEILTNVSQRVKRIYYQE